MKYNLLFLSLLFTSPLICAQNSPEIYSAYINNKMDQWKSIIDRMESLQGKSNKATLELVNYQYGYIGYCLEVEKEDVAKKYFVAANKNIEILDKANYEPSTINAYKSAFYGIRISFNSISAPFNGPKSLDYAKLSLKQDSLNYMANIQYGNAMFNMPSAFGGSKEEALKYFLKAKVLLDRNPDKTLNDWNYMRLLIFIAETYSSLEDFSKAKEVYDTILNREPEFIHVKNELYPLLLRKMKK